MDISEKKLIWIVRILLLLVTIAAFSAVLKNDFISYDDHQYVTENQHVLDGITPQGILWAFTPGYAGNWHPLTWISHMLDCEFFGTNPSLHHLTNLLLHLISTLLLFEILRRTTGNFWPSAFTALLFGIHPMHVESVAWIAERKDVLSGLFWMVTIAAYIRYAKRPGAGRYVLVLLCFALGLMSKPMVMTLPFVLLLLDYWPLERISFKGANSILPPSEESSTANSYKPLLFRDAVAEKIPLIILSAISCTVTFILQQRGGAMLLMEREMAPFASRLSNILIAYMNYISSMFIPKDMAILYPYPAESPPVWQPIAAFVMLGIISALVIWTVKRKRYLTVGWLWYLGTLVPVIGFVQIGFHSMADRYTYLPYIGLFIIVAWGVSDLFSKWRYRKIVLGISAGSLLVVMLICTRTQVGYWQNNLTLYEHVLKVTDNNFVIHYNMGMALAVEKRYDQAEAQFRKTLEIKPDFDQAMSDLGNALLMQDRADEALVQYKKALEINPDNSLAHYNIGLVLESKRSRAESIESFRQAIQVDPANIPARYKLAQSLIDKRKIEEGISELKEVIRQKPDWAEPVNYLAWLLATSKEPKFRDSKEAVILAEKACQLTDYSDFQALDTLAAAYAADGRFSEAVTNIEKALERARSLGLGNAVKDFQSRLLLYKAKKPYIEP